jgi:hypothetical protein
MKSPWRTPRTLSYYDCPVAGKPAVFYGKLR